MHGRFDCASPERGAVFFAHFCPPPPPEQDETGTIRKHRNRTTEYAKTGLEQDADSEIHALVCGPKDLQIAVTTWREDQENDNFSAW